MKATLKLAAILFLVCGLASGSLAFVNLATKDRIAAFAKEEQAASLKLLFPAAEEFRALDSGKDWDALSAGAAIGSVHRLSVNGYSGFITLVFGMDLEGKLTGVRVLLHTETPGLGAKITTAGFTDQYVGRTLVEVVLKKDDPANGAIDAIAAATISSRAVTRAVHDAMSAAQAKGGQ